MHGTARAQGRREELHWGGNSNKGNVLSHVWKTKMQNRQLREWRSLGSCSPCSCHYMLFCRSSGTSWLHGSAWKVKRSLNTHIIYINIYIYIHICIYLVVDDQQHAVLMIEFQITVWQRLLLNERCSQLKHLSYEVLQDLMIM